MHLNDLLSEITALDLPSLKKVESLVETLLGDQDQSDEWESVVWNSLRNCSSSEHALPLAPYAKVASVSKQRKLLRDGSEVMLEFLSRVTGDTHPARLRPSLNFVVSVGVRHMQRRNIPLTINTLLQTLPSFPAYLANAFPGSTATPAQFSMIRTLHAKKRSV